MLRGKVALVLCGSSPLGYSIASYASRQDAVVFVATNQTEETCQYMKLLRDEFPSIVCVQNDLKTESEIVATVQQVIESQKRIDILFHVSDFGEEKWDRVAHLKSVMFATKACIPPMIQQEYGRVVITTALWTSANPGAAATQQYTASKAGILSFVRAAAMDLAQYNVTINAVEPGILQYSMRSAGEDSMIPMGRAGRTEEVSVPAGFLASDGASYITGQWLNVSGGFGLVAAKSGNTPTSSTPASPHPAGEQAALTPQQALSSGTAQMHQPSQQPSTITAPQTKQSNQSRSKTLLEA